MVEHLPVGEQDFVGVLVSAVDQAAHFFVDGSGDLLGVVALMAHVATEENLGVVAAVADRAEPFGHAVLRDHGPGDTGGFFDVVGSTRGGVVEHHFFGRPSPEHVGQLVEHLVAGGGVLFFVGQHHGVAQGAAAGQDGHLVHGIGMGQGCGNQRVPAFVVGRDSALVVVHHPRALLRAGQHSVDRLIES